MSSDDDWDLALSDDDVDDDDDDDDDEAQTAEAARPGMAASQSRFCVGALVATKASTFDGPDKSHAWSKGAYGSAWASAVCVGKIAAAGIAPHEWTVLFDDGDDFDCTERQLLCRVPKDGQSTRRLSQASEDVQPVVVDGRQQVQH